MADAIYMAHRDTRGKAHLESIEWNYLTGKITRTEYQGHSENFIQTTYVLFLVAFMLTSNFIIF